VSNSTQMLDTSELTDISGLVDSIQSHSTVISNSSQILDSANSSEISDSSDSCELDTPQKSGSAVSEYLSQIPDSTKTLDVPITVDSVRSDTLVIPYSTGIADSLQSGEVPLSTDSVDSSTSQISCTSQSVYSNNILKSSNAVDVSLSVHTVNSNIYTPLVELDSSVANEHPVAVSSYSLIVTESSEIMKSTNSVQSQSIDISNTSVVVNSS
jgi:hypothetical protein